MKGDPQQRNWEGKKSWIPFRLVGFAGQRFFCLLPSCSFISLSLSHLCSQFLPQHCPFLSIPPFASFTSSFPAWLNPCLCRELISFPCPIPLFLILWLSPLLSCLCSDRVRKLYLSVASSCTNFNFQIPFKPEQTQENCVVQQKDSYLRSDVVISTPHKARNDLNYTEWSIAQLVLFKELLNCLKAQFRNLKSEFKQILL